MCNAIIIPCYNESNRLDWNQFSSFLRAQNDYKLFFVNDGSTDDTLTYLEKFASEHSGRVFVINKVQNAGKAEAVRTGILHVTQNFNVESVGFIDADLSTDFEDYTALVDTMLDRNEQRTLVFGSRNNGTGEIKRSAKRKLFSNFFKFFIQQILQLPVNDTQCGAKVLSPELAAHVFQDSFLTRWLFDVEMFIRAKKFYGGRQIMNKIKEQPLKRWVHMEGSKITLKDSIQMPKQLMQIYLNYQFKPVFKTAGESVTNTVARMIAPLSVKNAA